MTEQAIETDIDEQFQAAIKSSLGTDDEIEVEHEEETQDDPKPTSTPSKWDEEARSMGHTSLEEWVANGKDADDWVSPKEYVRWGKQKEEIRKLKEDHQRDKEEQRQWLEYQKQQAIDEIKKRRDEAVRYADEDAFKTAQGQLDQLQVRPQGQPVPVGPHPAIAKWEAENKWITDKSSPKAKFADGLYHQFVATNPNATPEQLINYIDNEVNKVFPKTNPLRDTPTQTERNFNTQTPSKQPKQKLSFKDLSSVERNQWDGYGKNLFGETDQGKAKFLAAVLKDRESQRR